MCTPILKLLPRILLQSFLFSVILCHASASPDLSAVFPFDASYLKRLKPSDQSLNSDIMVVGGKEAMLLEKELKIALKDDFKISSITGPEFNLARIYTLLTHHQFGAKWVIYLPSLEDENELIFHQEDAQAIQYNLRRIHTWWWPLIHKIWPGLALSLLKKVKQVTLQNDPSHTLIDLNDSKKIQHALTHAALFKTLLEQLIQKKKQTKFLLISTPFNINLTPQSCRTSISWPTKNLMKEQILTIQQQNWEKALEVNEELKQVAPYYASTYFLRAKILKELNDLEGVNQFINLSWMMNCRSPYVALKNSILQSLTSTSSDRIYFYNFANFITEQCFGKPTCFQGTELDGHYYSIVAQVIKSMISKDH